MEHGEVQTFNWVQDEAMIADVLTKEMKHKEGLDDLLLKNKLQSITSRDNSVRFETGEFQITGRRLREKLAPKKNNPMKKKIKKMTRTEDTVTTNLEDE